MQGNGLWDNLYQTGQAEELKADFEEAGIIDEPMPDSSGGADDGGGGENPKEDDPENLPNKGEKLTNKQKFENRKFLWAKKKQDRKNKKAEDANAKQASKEKRAERDELSRSKKQDDRRASERKEFKTKNFEDRKDAAQKAEADVTPSQESYNDLMKLGAGVHATTQLGYNEGRSSGESDTNNRNGLTDADLAGQDSRIYDLEQAP